MTTENPDQHRMLIAQVGYEYARQHGLNHNHHARVWCACMIDPVGVSWSERSASEIVYDPNRLASYDHIAVIDVRIPDAALNVWREHVRTGKRWIP